MKQFTFVVETFITSKDESIILVREPRTGQIIKSFNDPAQLASFLAETIDSVKNHSNSKDDEK